MKKSFLKFSSTFLLLTTIGMTGTNAANVWGAEEGTKVIVEDTKWIQLERELLFLKDQKDSHVHLQC